jgi:hypothetical protein
VVHGWYLLMPLEPTAWRFEDYLIEDYMRFRL